MFISTLGLAGFNTAEYAKLRLELEVAHAKLVEGDRKSQDNLGWMQPLDPDDEQVGKIIAAAEQIRRDADVLLVIGAGGSYLGARAGIEMLAGRSGTEILFLGHHLCTANLKEVFAKLKGRRVAVNVVSKSGTTLEPAIAFRLARRWMIDQYGVEEATRRIYVTTDPEKGALLAMAKKNGYKSFSIPERVGGRYSVLTVAGLLPMAVHGADIREMLRGAQEAARLYTNPRLEANTCYQYAVYRNFWYRNGKSIELLAGYDTRLRTLSDWWQQLFAESEGKDGKGIFPAVVQLTTDLHSVGQYIQQGPRHLLQTVLWVKQSDLNVTLPEMEDDLDGLGYLTGQDLHEINKRAFLGALTAHTNGGVPNVVLHLPDLTEQTIGHMFYFFMKACAVSSLLLGVNPFDQPGVEAYKRQMFHLLEERRTS
ncbi:hypothetical protein CIG75_02620 [Tumebacillus algifaecis]|uniref:Glucose-6-phosphate isomerase n=1 Tax=Tumebacillus algifaecis TaxID=1214604 RepID=A0A223CXZ6_9BACL|nr:glucose-6-phosphate isomerase [Tumebacillus algifaecis]ASS73983.1 hypothetical protein CIG75_02620 [Tumebacillus algifaecis]